MISSDRLVVFFVSSLALLLVPGPAVTFIVTRSLTQGRVAGLVSALGIQCGGLVHVLAATLGVSAILASSALAFNVVKFAGAAYLVFLGVRALLSKDEALTSEIKPEPLRSIYLQGLVVNILNPKTALFFLAFLPQFVNTAGNVALQTLVLGLAFVTLATITDSLWALLAGTIGRALERSRQAQRGRKYVTGGVFIGLGVTAAFTGSVHK